jgi:hypothetical protein
VNKTERQLIRLNDLLEQFKEAADVLVGRSALVVLPGEGSRHDPNMFRPVHTESFYFPSRPQLVLLSVVAEDRLILSFVESRPFRNKLVYKIRHSENLMAPDESGNTIYTRENAPHVLMTAGNNLLQELVNTADIPSAVTDLVLPRLVVQTDAVRIDENKLAQLAVATGIESESLRTLWMQRRRESAEIMSCNTLFADAELISDAEIAAAFRQYRAYEDYEPLLGSPESNPARKVFMAKNPAKDVLKAAGLGPDWAAAANDELIDSLLKTMRAQLPIPELALYTDLLDGLAQPDKPLNFSNSVNHVSSSAVVRAMRSAIPTLSALLKHVTDEELITAARNPSEPLIVHAYARIQQFPTEQLYNLPNYAEGNFVPPEGPNSLELSAE